jgi:hypothetical protein
LKPCSAKSNFYDRSAEVHKISLSLFFDQKFDKRFSDGSQLHCDCSEAHGSQCLRDR